MPVTSAGLKTFIQNKINSLTDEQRIDPAQVQQAWADGVSEYLNGNLQVSGVYAGTITDPSNGTYDWTFSDIIIDAATLLSQAASGGFTSWITSLELQMAPGSVLGADDSVLGADDSAIITTSVPVTLAGISLNITQGDMSSSADHDTTLTLFCNKFISELLLTSITPLTSAATSTTAGTGIVTFAALK